MASLPTFHSFSGTAAAGAPQQGHNLKHKDNSPQTLSDETQAQSFQVTEADGLVTPFQPAVDPQGSFKSVVPGSDCSELPVHGQLQGEETIATHSGKDSQVPEKLRDIIILNTTFNFKASNPSQATVKDSTRHTIQPEANNSPRSFSSDPRLDWIKDLPEAQPCPKNGRCGWKISIRGHHITSRPDLQKFLELAQFSEDSESALWLQSLLDDPTSNQTISDTSNPTSDSDASESESVSDTAELEANYLNTNDSHGFIIMLLSTIVLFFAGLIALGHPAIYRSDVNGGHIILNNMGFLVGATIVLLPLAIMVSLL